MATTPEDPKVASLARSLADSLTSSATPEQMNRIMSELTDEQKAAFRDAIALMAAKQGRPVNEDLRNRLGEFIRSAFAATQGKLAMKVELIYCPGSGFRDEPMRVWERLDRPEIFEQPELTETLIGQIIGLAEDHADNAGPGTRRFTVRVHEYFGSRPLFRFAVKPSHDSYGGERPGVPSEQLGPVIPPEETAWFAVGVRWEPAGHVGERALDKLHKITVTCEHCGASETFDTSGRVIHQDSVSPRHVGDWMINHRRLHR